MKKILLLLIPAIILSIIVICNKGSNTLYLLNWGEYIDPTLLDSFEEEYDVTVVMDEVGSSEDMYQKIKAKTTAYDVAIPGDYMIERMYKENMLLSIDYSNMDNYSSDMFNDDLTNIRRNNYFEGNENYCVPYFWGAYALIYSNKKSYVEEVVKENGFNAIFDRSIYGEHSKDVKLAMYDIPRFGITAYLLTKDKDINSTNRNDYIGADTALKNANYQMWGNDGIKKQIASGNLDVGLVQLGDFFDQYYLSIESSEEVDFSCYIPDKTAAFFDAMTIPNTCKHKDLAEKFINFMINPDNATQNAEYVGYSPTLKSVIRNIQENEDYEDILTNYPFYLDPLNGNVCPIFRDIPKLSDGTDYQDFLLEIYNRAKAK